MKEIINYYEILGVKENATYAEIKSARNKLIKQYHPDKDQSKKAYEKTEQINSAYKVLSSVDLRKKHDDMLRELRKEKQEFEEINNIKEQSVKEKKPNIFVRIFNYFKNLRKNRIKLKEEKKLSKQEQKENKFTSEERKFYVTYYTSAMTSCVILWIDQGMKEKVEDITKYWTDKENLLSYLINHDHTEEIGVCLDQLNSYLETNKPQEFKEMISLVIYYCKCHKQILIISMQNIL